MIILDRFVEGPQDCMYLPGRNARLEYEVAAALTPEEYEARMNAGWRKFGLFLFHPVCSACAECRPIRTMVERFHPDRSQKRALQRNADLEVRFAAPTVDAARLDLWRRYQKAQTVQKNWPDEERTAEGYAMNFVRNPLPAVEIAVYEGAILRAIGLADVTPNVVSGVYHYYEPECRDRSLGTFVILQTLELARRLGRPFAYLGYHVAGCGSMTYKSRFQPCEILGTDGIWREHKR